MEGLLVAALTATSTPKVDVELGVGSVRQQVVKLVRAALAATVLDVDGIKPLVKACKHPNHGDYQCDNAMGIWSKIKAPSAPFRNQNAVGQVIAANLPPSSLTASVSVAGSGFVNIFLSNRWIEAKLCQLLAHGVRAWAPVLPYKRVVVDFSSPNIAKDMHVGHLWSTIIGDSLCRVLEYCGADVLRRNHVGDWGTQFRMLIEFLFEQFPNWEEIGDQDVGDLQSFYKQAKIKFDSNPAFKLKAQKAVVLLQRGDLNYQAAWKKICDVSCRNFNEIYKRLHVTLEEKGESAYNNYVPRIVKELEAKGLVEDSDGARIITIPSHTVPLILVKRDGGFNYASTDMTALWYRLKEENADVILYVTDMGQSQHFDMIFKAAKLAGWLPADELALPHARHVGFGLVLGEDKKRLRTRSSEVTRLVDLLDKAKLQSKKRPVKDGDQWFAQEFSEEDAEALGYGAVKYADLKNNRMTDYKFDSNHMLDFQGNTVVYLLYAHARIHSIIEKSGKEIEAIKQTGQMWLLHPSERALGLHLIRFGECVEDVAMDLLPNVLYDYLYKLSETATTFYKECKVVGSEQEESRLLLCEATVVIMRECFNLLGITTLYRL